MKTQYFTAASVDGFIADEDNSLDWLLQLGDESGRTYDEFLAEVGAIAMGATTYEWILHHHVNPHADRPRPWAYSQPCWVFSNRELPCVTGADIRFVHGEVAPVHAAMAETAAGKNIWILGGGNLAAQFHDHGLLDELVLGVAPVVLGAGTPLLPRAITQPPMRLLDVIEEGPFAMLRYAFSART